MPEGSPAARGTTPVPSIQRCLRCGHTLPELDARSVCPQCGGLLELVHSPPELRGAALAESFRRSTSPSGVWRFGALVLPGSERDRVSFPEGNTPALESDRVRRWTGATWLRLKHEGLNPTGSFKDRGMAVGVTQALRIGARGVVCASTGNTGASLASYAARAGLPALVLVPAGRIAVGKLTQTMAYGARILAVRGDFDDCLRLVREASDELGLYLLNSVNPFRIEGQKTIVLELLEQLGWDPPDWLALPAGNLGNTAAFGAALREALAFGLIPRAPRLLAVQSSGAAPFAASFDDDFRTLKPVKACTIATAINIGNPASFERAVPAIRETRGIVRAVSDEEILDAKGEVDAAGIGCEPASAASVAGVRRLVHEGFISPGERVVAVLTGHVLKDPDIILSEAESRRGASRPSRPAEVEPTIAAVAAAARLS
ncbi:MAG TPA: threonine synthase [Gemmatimonadaceae bacterium]|nr:threonine synthase [Gemmatimonadaceae bacterium]